MACTLHHDAFACAVLSRTTVGWVLGQAPTEQVSLVLLCPEKQQCAIPEQRCLVGDLAVRMVYLMLWI